MFNWSTIVQIYVELKHFKTEIRNIILTRHYQINNDEKVPIIQTWLETKGLQFILMLTQL